MKFTDKQLDAVRDQFVYLFEDSYKAHNDKITTTEDKIFESLFEEHSILGEFIEHADGGSQSSYVTPQVSKVRGFLRHKYSDKFKDLPRKKNLYDLKEVIRRDASLIAIESKSVDEIMIKLSAKYKP